MSRLLHAAARGARIQALDKNLGAILSSHAPLELSNDKRPYRIHPDDAHLQYGPISTALRGTAAQDFSVYEDPHWVHTYAAYEIADTYATSWERKYKDENQRVLFLLILAEALAEEGM